MLAKWLKEYFNATGHTKAFYWTWIIFGICLIITTIYVYARLDFVRSDRKSVPQPTKESIEFFQS